MKFLHVSDLHLGKRLHETSFIEDQAEILNQILNVVDDEKPNGILIAGDVYDKSVPSAEAVSLFDAFLAQLANRKVKTFVISGNHDSPERIAFGSKIMDASGIYLSPVYDGTVTPIRLQDDFGEVNVYLLPFIKPAHVRRFYEDEEITSYTDAMKVAIAHMFVDESARNILVSHQFVTGGVRSESEENVGGTDNVDVTVFEPFDYVALGHLHAPQNCGEKVRYCGTPLKYSFSEVAHEKSITVVTLGKKGDDLDLRTIPLKATRDMQKIKGSFAQLTSPDYYTNNPMVDAYLQITLTDEDDIPDAMARLQEIYRNALDLRYDNARTKADAVVDGGEISVEKSAYELFAEFFEQQNNVEMTPAQQDYMQKLIQTIKEGV